jgi:hypothetical protein
LREGIAAHALTGRSQHRVLKVARTIADLAHREVVDEGMSPKRSVTGGSRWRLNEGEGATP